MQGRYLFVCLSSVLFLAFIADSAVAESQDTSLQGAVSIDEMMTESVAEDDIIEEYQTEVRESRPKMSASNKVITQSKIARSNPKSADDIVGVTPGVSIVQHGSEGKGHQIIIQGFDAAHGSNVEVLLEGVGMNEPSHVHGQGYLDLYGIIPELVSKMEVSKGAFLPWQGDFALAGSLQLSLGLSEEHRPGFLSFEGSHRGRFRAVAAAGPKDANNETFGAVDLVKDLGFGPDRDASRAAFLGQYRHETKNKGNLLFLLSMQSARFESPETLKLSDVNNKKKDFLGSYSPPGNGLSDRVMTKISYKHEFPKGNFEVAGFALYRDFLLEENFTGNLWFSEHGDLRRQVQRGFSGGFFSNLEQKIPVNIPTRLLAGMGWRMDVNNQWEQQLDLDKEPWQNNRDLKYSLNSLFGYTGIGINPFHWFTLLPSVRAAIFGVSVNDKLQNKSVSEIEATVLPRLAVSFPVNDKFCFFIDYGRGYRSFEAGAVAALPVEKIEDERLSQYRGGSPKITVADTGEVGLKSSPVKILSFSLLGFFAFVEREMVFDHVSNINIAMDGTRRIGASADLEIRPLSWMTLTGELTFVDAKFNRSGNKVPGVPVFMGTGSLELGRNRGPQFNTRLVWCGERPLAYGATASGYAKLNVSFGWRFEKFYVGAIVDNATNMKIMDGVYNFASHFDDDEPRSLIPSVHYAAGEPITARFYMTVYL